MSHLSVKFIWPVMNRKFCTIIYFTFFVHMFVYVVDLHKGSPTHSKMWCTGILANYEIYSGYGLVTCKYSSL